MGKTIIPVALFAYARPAHLEKTLEGLRRNKVPLIYAFSDGPADKTKVKKVKEVRQLLKKINWAKIIIKEWDSNLGLGISIRAGVSEVLNKHEKIIIVEDDIVLRPGAYNYVCKALDYYENSENVMSISMWSFPTLKPKDCYDGFFSERFVCWGWGTYRKYWEYYDKDPEKLFYEAIQKRKDLLNWGKDIRVQALNAKKYNVWYIGYALIHFIYNKLSYFPAETLVINIGRNEQATHTKKGISDNFEIINRPVSLPRKWPDVVIKKNTANKFRNYFDFENKNMITRFFIKIYKFNGKVIFKIFNK